MADIFLRLINMSIAASCLAMVVIFLRLLLKKTSRWIICLLWALVAVRLVCPLSFESEFSLLPDSVGSGELVFEWVGDSVGTTGTINEDYTYYNASSFTGRKPISYGEGGYYMTAGYDKSGEPDAAKSIVVSVLSLLWFAGVVLLCAYAVFGYIRLHRRIRTAVRLQDNIYQSEKCDTPFVLGFVRPRIFLPFGLNDEDVPYVVAHEQAHIGRSDHVLKPFAFLLLSLHWFNPVIWAAYVLFCRDIELACDERVIKNLGVQQRADYSNALLTCSLPRRAIAACPLAFGEVGVKQRVKNILSYKKPTFWITAATVLLCAAVAVCFLTNPQSPSPAAPKVTDSPLHSKEGEKLTLDDVVALSKKGKNLDWGDFNKYTYYETGSGLYIRVYEIDPDFSLWIGGGYLEEKPMYFHLTSKLNLDDFIDIRDGDVKTFIDNHRNSTLEWAITKAILAQNKDKNPDDLIHVESHVILDKTEQSATPKLGSKKHSGTVTVYMNVLELSYSTYGGELKEVGGSSIPTVITFKVDEYGNYTIEEYWIPRDGSYYASDIDKKFTDIAKEALRKLEDSGDDIQQNECLKKAQSRLMLIGTIDKKIAGLLETVCSSPATSSNPGDYIAAHKAEYDELVSHGENTLRYCFSEFLKGGQTDLRGHIMALVCQDIAENAGEAFTIDGYLSTGQDWFDAFLKNAEDMQKRIPAEDLEKLYPVSYLLLQISSRPLCTYCYETAGTYRFDGGGDILKSASVKLDENGEFIMTFSPVSSYIGHGKYSVDNDRLTLKTDDGWFTYAFHVGLGENGTILIFNAAASSDNVWYSGITNGSVFRQ